MCLIKKSKRLKTRRNKNMEKTQSKLELINFVKGVDLTTIKDQNVVDMVNYTLKELGKNSAKVSKSDLKDLVDSINEAQGNTKPNLFSEEEGVEVDTKVTLGATIEPEAPKAKKVKAVKKVKKAEEVVEEAPQEKTQEEVVETPKKKAAPKKVAPKTKKAEPKKKEETPKIETAHTLGEQYGVLPVAKIFPKNITLPNGINLEVVKPEEVRNYEDFKKLIESGEQVYIAGYWTKRHIKQFNYCACMGVYSDCDYAYDFLKKGFPNDLDIAEPLTLCEFSDRVYAISLYSECIYPVDGESFTPIEDVDPYTGEKFQLRVSVNMEFELYRPVSEK